jgi:rubrerythrin
MHSFAIFMSTRSPSGLSRISPGTKSNATAEYIHLVKSAVMGECNSIAALHGFLNESVSDDDFAAYVSLWSAQELQHHFAFRTYLEKVGETIAPGKVEATRPPYPPGNTHASTLATNIISELTVCHVYHRVSKAVEEPVLSDILARVSQDESRHACEFLYYTRRRLDQHRRKWVLCSRRSTCTSAIPKRRCRRAWYVCEKGVRRGEGLRRDEVWPGRASVRPGGRL